MPSVNIPPTVLQSSFKFRFSDDPPRRVRHGNLVELKIPQVRASDKYNNKDYHTKKYYQLTGALQSQLFWCIECSSQAQQALIFRNYGVFQVRKYCSTHVEKNIVKL